MKTNNTTSTFHGLKRGEVLRFDPFWLQKKGGNPTCFDFYNETVYEGETLEEGVSLLKQSTATENMINYRVKIDSRFTMAMSNRAKFLVITPNSEDYSDKRELLERARLWKEVT